MCVAMFHSVFLRNPRARKIKPRDRQRFKERKGDAAKSSPRVDADSRKVLERIVGQMGWPGNGDTLV